MSAEIAYNGDMTGVIDVSTMDASKVSEFAQDAGDAYFERKGGRTFLITP